MAKERLDGYPLFLWDSTTLRKLASNRKCAIFPRIWEVFYKGYWIAERAGKGWFYGIWLNPSTQGFSKPILSLRKFRAISAETIRYCSLSVCYWIAMGVIQKLRFLRICRFHCGNIRPPHLRISSDIQEPPLPHCHFRRTVKSRHCLHFRILHQIARFFSERESTHFRSRRKWIKSILTWTKN